jgi:hypothetical protein
VARATLPANHRAAILRRVARDGFCTCTLRDGRPYFNYADGTAIRDAGKSLLSPAAFKRLGLIPDKNDTLFGLKDIAQVWRARRPDDGEA